MIANATYAPQSTSQTDHESLLQQIDVLTRRQVRQLDICRDGECVSVKGYTRTWYVKQLVTQAILTAEPDIDLNNEIQVFSA